MISVLWRSTGRSTESVCPHARSGGRDNYSARGGRGLRYARANGWQRKKLMEEECGDSGGAPLEWQGRLEELQMKHKEESEEQQRLHLAQLLQLQDLLLNELVTQCSGSEPLDEAVKTEVLLSLGLNQVEGEEEKDASLPRPSMVPNEQLHTVQSTGGHFGHAPFLPATPNLTGDVDEEEAIVSHPPPAPLNTARHPSPDQQPLSSLSIASTEYLELPATSHGAPLSLQEIPPSPPPPHNKESQAGLELAVSAAYKTPQQFLPVAPDAGNWRAGSHDKSNSRSALMEKHARHIEDLQNYYETQISSLQQQLSLKLSARRERPMVSPSLSPAKNTSPARRLSFSPTKGRWQGRHSKHQEWPDSEVLMKENQRLKSRCAGLEQQLEDHHK